MTQLKDVVAISAVRTPMGRFGGSLKDVPVYDLGAAAIKAALARAGVSGNEITEVIYGCCRQAGNGPNPARTASVRGGVPVGVPVQTINMACPSGMMAMGLCARALQLGEGRYYVTGGMESMSTIPYLLKDVRWKGFRMGDKTLLDGWSDSIDPLCGYGMGVTAENLVDKYGLEREPMDVFAAESHLKAAAAWKAGAFDDEVIHVEVPAASKEEPAFTFSKDETIREDANPAAMAKLRPAFKKDGKVTAGNACGMSDGASAIVLTTREAAKAAGRQPLFSILGWASAAVDPKTMGEGPGIAIPIALERAGMKISDMDFIEVNEAFAAQVLANEKMLGWDRAKLNVNGGAIALGHPTGNSGARIVVTLYNILKKRSGTVGVAGICGGGGVTTAMVIRREG